MIYDNRPIGVFDSGVGGISVLRELTSIMPNENYIYFGDSLNAPYGTRPLDEVRELTFHTAGHLIGMGCKCLVIACNTATTAAVRALRARYEGVPVIGIEPALKPAVLHKPHGRVLVLATAVTLHEEKFHRLMARYENDADIFTLACPGIVEFVERGIIEGEELTEYLKQLLQDYIDNPPDAVVLGCTHYPFVRKAIDSVLGGHAEIFDGGNGTAREAGHQLKLHDLCASPDSSGNVTILNSKPEMIPISEWLLKLPIE